MASRSTDPSPTVRRKSDGPSAPVNRYEPASIQQPLLNPVGGKHTVRVAVLRIGASADPVSE